MLSSIASLSEGCTMEESFRKVKDKTTDSEFSEKDAENIVGSVVETSSDESGASSKDRPSNVASVGVDRPPVAPATPAVREERDALNFEEAVGGQHLTHPPMLFNNKTALHSMFGMLQEASEATSCQNSPRKGLSRSAHTGKSRSRSASMNTSGNKSPVGKNDMEDIKRLFHRVDKTTTDIKFQMERLNFNIADQTAALIDQTRLQNLNWALSNSSMNSFDYYDLSVADKTKVQILVNWDASIHNSAPSSRRASNVSQGTAATIGSNTSPVPEGSLCGCNVGDNCCDGSILHRSTDLVNSILFSFRAGRGHVLPWGHLGRDARDYTEKSRQAFRDRIAQQIHELTGQKPRLVKSKQDGRYTIHYR